MGRINPAEVNLVTLSDVKSELGITGATEDGALTLQIARVSMAFAEYSEQQKRIVHEN